MTEENGYLIEEDKIFEGYVIPNGLPKRKVIGNRAFSKNMEYQGVLDMEKLALWHVEEGSLVELI